MLNYKKVFHCNISISILYKGNFILLLNLAFPLEMQLNHCLYFLNVTIV